MPYGLSYETEFWASQAIDACLAFPFKHACKLALVSRPIFFHHRRLSINNSDRISTIALGIFPTKTETNAATSITAGSSVQPLAIPAIVVVGQQFLSPYPVDLSVTEKTLSLTDGDYAVTDLNGNVIFKVKGVLMSMRDKCLLLDPSGNPIITLREKIRTIHDRWQAFRGDGSDSKDLLYSVKKSSLIQLRTSLDVFLASNSKEQVPNFKIQGSFFERSCTITNGDGSIVVAQVLTSGYG